MRLLTARPIFGSTAKPGIVTKIALLIKLLLTFYTPQL